MRTFLLIVAASALTGVPAVAQDVERYRLERTEAGYVRLDTVTGRMSICEERSGQLVCKAAVEEREAYDRDLGSLQDRLERVEQRLSRLEGQAAPGALPSDEEFEQTMGYMEKFFRRFMGIVKDLERDFGRGDPEPAPDRT